MKHDPPEKGDAKASSPTKTGAARKRRTPTGARLAQGDGADREQRVRETAYYYYEARGHVDGHEVEDWLRAEAEVEGVFGGEARKAESARH